MRLGEGGKTQSGSKMRDKRCGNKIRKSTYLAPAGLCYRGIMSFLIRKTTYLYAMNFDFIRMGMGSIYYIVYFLMS